MASCRVELSGPHIWCKNPHPQLIIWLKAYWSLPFIIIYACGWTADSFLIARMCFLISCCDVVLVCAPVEHPHSNCGEV